jgi:hypothetical protein
VTRKKDLKHLCLVSKLMYELTLPKLYESIVINPVSERYIKTLDIDLLLEARLESYKHTKHVRISAPFHENLSGRCILFRHIEDIAGISEMDYDWMMENGPEKSQKLESSMLKFLEKLQDERLISFKSAVTPMQRS